MDPKPLPRPPPDPSCAPPCGIFRRLRRATSGEGPDRVEGGERSEPPDFYLTQSDKITNSQPNYHFLQPEMPPKCSQILIWQSRLAMPIALAPEGTRWSSAGSSPGIPGLRSRFRASSRGFPREFLDGMAQNWILDAST